MPSAQEIEQIIEVPLSFFFDPRFQRTETRLFRSEEHEIYFYDYQSHVIWGATAKIVRNLIEAVGDLPAVQALRNG